MTWFKIDDSFYDHPKVFDAPDCAVALWTRAGAWSARNLTEGFVPSGMPARLCDDPDTAVKELVRRGLWLRTTGGWRFHDWNAYQPSRAAVEDLRTKRAAAGRKGGKARASNRDLTGYRPVDNGMVTGAQMISNSGAPAASRSSTTHNPLTSGSKANGKQVLSKSQASARPVAKQNPTPTRPSALSEQRGTGTSPAPERAPGAAPSTPVGSGYVAHHLAQTEADDELAATAEANVAAIAEAQARVQRGVALARAAIGLTPPQQSDRTAEGAP